MSNNIQIQRKKGQLIYKSSSISPTSDISTIDKNYSDKFNSNLVKTRSTNQFVQVKQNSSLNSRFFFTIFGLIILLLAVAAIVVSIILNINKSSNCSSGSVTTTAIITSTTTTALYSCSNYTITINWDYPNHDIASISPMTFDVCCSWCLATSSCTTFVFTSSSSQCWIKTSTGGGGAAAALKIAATI